MSTRRLFRWIAALALPFALIFGTVLVVDPYTYFDRSHLIPEALKRKNLYHNGRTMPFSNLLWKLIELRRAPQDRILLGDSRLSHFDLDHLQAVSGHRYYNLGVPGGNTRTLADLFTFAARAPLKEVVVQVSFRGMNRGMDWDLYSEPRLLLDQPFLYLSNRRVLEATLLNLRSAWLPSSVQYDALPPDHWQRVLEMERTNANDFSLDSAAFERLERIAARCTAMGCSLRFVEYPTHPEVQRIYAEAGLEPLRATYLERLRELAPLIDLDRPGLFPSDKDLWRDPLHLTTEAQRAVIDTVWSGGAH
jgi:hypothetical protein